LFVASAESALSFRSGPVAFAAGLWACGVTATAVMSVSHCGVLLSRARLALCRALQPRPGRREPAIRPRRARTAPSASGWRRRLRRKPRGGQPGRCRTGLL